MALRFEEERIQADMNESNGAATMLQRQMRGRAARQQVCLMRQDKEINSAATKLQSAQRRIAAKKEVDLIRFEKNEEVRLTQQKNHEERVSATRVQALFRGNQSRAGNGELLDELKAIKAAKEAMIIARAVVRMQCGWRKNRARKHFKKRQRVAEEEKKKREEDEELERNLDALHKEQEQLLYVLRVQNAFRVRKAKKKFDFMRIAHMKMGEVAREKRRMDGIVRIQNWFRGIKTRRWFARNLMNLKQELQSRSWCVECVAQLATRRCTTCLDRYCVDCWKVIHRKGRKRQHGYDIIDITKLKPGQQQQQQQQSNMFAANGFMEGSSLSLGGHESSITTSGSINEWTEYFDESAGAKYWYNINTGEASWIKPF